MKRVEPIGTDLSRYMYERGISDTEMALIVGRSISQIGRIRKGICRPTKPTAKAIEEATGGLVRLPTKKASGRQLGRGNCADARITKRLWQIKNRVKVLAHKAVEHAINRGDLVRQPCDRCGAPIAQAHHDDHTKQLDVIWLCALHHAERHRELSSQVRAAE